MPDLAPLLAAQGDEKVFTIAREDARAYAGRCVGWIGKEKRQRKSTRVKLLAPWQERDTVTLAQGTLQTVAPPPTARNRGSKRKSEYVP